MAFPNLSVRPAQNSWHPFAVRVLLAVKSLVERFEKPKAYSFTLPTALGCDLYFGLCGSKNMWLYGDNNSLLPQDALFSQKSSSSVG